jgi:ribA/ribD-fused uncharacterized protein
MINSFTGEYSWLSNFEPVEIEFNGIKYPSVEHAYMSAKSGDPQWKKLCAIIPSAGKIKRASREVDLVPNWEEVKVSVMWECIVQKFSQQPFKGRLLATGFETLIEGNNHKDEYWGVSLKTHMGRNMLGGLIMHYRAIMM